MFSVGDSYFASVYSDKTAHDEDSGFRLLLIVHQHRCIRGVYGGGTESKEDGKTVN
ncbi:MAG: hypothetical protein IE931_14160 [Sphingobacteriales bacterium]|nr:hypothetical protein [Sphingobacteriales bacterium]